MRCSFLGWRVVIGIASLVSRLAGRRGREGVRLGLGATSYLCLGHRVIPVLSYLGLYYLSENRVEGKVEA